MSENSHLSINGSQIELKNKTDPTYSSPSKDSSKVTKPEPTNGGDCSGQDSAVVSENGTIEGERCNDGGNCPVTSKDPEHCLPNGDNVHPPNPANIEHGACVDSSLECDKEKVKVGNFPDKDSEVPGQRTKQYSGKTDNNTHGFSEPMFGADSCDTEEYSLETVIFHSARQTDHAISDSDEDMGNCTDSEPEPDWDFSPQQFFSWLYRVFATQTRGLSYSGYWLIGMILVMLPWVSRTKRDCDYDTERYLEGYPDLEDNPYANDNLKFYENELRSRPDGQYIEDFHTRWFGDYGRLEREHGFIQWLFPIREGGMNVQAQDLQPHEAEEIKSSEKLRNRVLKSFTLMLDFYGMELTEDKIRRADNYQERYRHLNRSFHNYLRITRILKCLGELGLDYLQPIWVERFLKETVRDETLPRCKESCLSYWLPVVKNEQERERLYNMYAQFEREKFEKKSGRTTASNEGKRYESGQDGSSVNHPKETTVSYKRPASGDSDCKENKLSSSTKKQQETSHKSPEDDYTNEDSCTEALDEVDGSSHHDGDRPSPQEDVKRTDNDDTSVRRSSTEQKPMETG